MDVQFKEKLRQVEGGIKRLVLNFKKELGLYFADHYYQVCLDSYNTLLLVLETRIHIEGQPRYKSVLIKPESDIGVKLKELLEAARSDIQEYDLSEGKLAFLIDFEFGSESERTGYQEVYEARTKEAVCKDLERRYGRGFAYENECYDTSEGNIKRLISINEIPKAALFHIKLHMSISLNSVD